jgi:hypothetical protein
MKPNDESVQPKSTEPRQLSDLQLEAAYAIGGDWAIRAASKASFRAKPCLRPRTEKENQRFTRWMLLYKFFGNYAAAQIAAANGLLKRPAKASLEAGIAAANEFGFDPNVLLKDAVKLVKGRWWIVEYAVKTIKAAPELWTDSELSRLRMEVQWT